MPTKDRLERLKERKAEIESQLAALEARVKAKERKEDTRLKVLIGAAILADAKRNASIVPAVKKILQRAITKKHDRDFLRRKGWLDPNSGQKAGQ